MNHYTFEKTSAGSSPVNSDSRATGTGTAPAVKCIASFCLDFLAACKIQCSKSVQVLCHLETYNIYYTSSGTNFDFTNHLKPTDISYSLSM